MPPVASKSTEEDRLRVATWIDEHLQRAACNGVDASAVISSREKFNGAVELRRLTLKRKDEFVRNLTAKVLGYALGRSQQDGDECTIQRIV